MKLKHIKNNIVDYHYDSQWRKQGVYNNHFFKFYSFYKNDLQDGEFIDCDPDFKL